MIDHRQLTFDSSGISGITLMQDQHLGLSIVTNLEGGHVIASLNPESPFEVMFLQPDEGPGPRFFIPDCELWLNPSALGDARSDPPLGSLILAEAGVSVMVKAPRSSPTPLRLTGAVIRNAYEGLAITSWRLQSSPKFGKPEVLYRFESTEGGTD